MSPDVRTARIAAGQHGVISVAQALSGGLTRDAVDSRLRTGRWVSVQRGVYLVNGAPLTFEGRVMAATLATGGVASHRTAAALWGLAAAPKGAVDVTIGEARRRQATAVRVHRSSVLDRPDVTSLGAIPITTRVRTIIDLAACVSEDVLGAIVDEACRRRLTSIDVIRARMTAIGRRGRRGMSRLDRVVSEREASGVPESVLERELYDLLVAAGLPAPVRQFDVVDPSGRWVARADMAYPDARLVIEVDGFAFHSGKRAFENDRKRLRRINDAGYRVLPFSATDIRATGANTVAEVRAALRSARFGDFGVDMTPRSPKLRDEST